MLVILPNRIKLPRLQLRFASFESLTRRTLENMHLCFCSCLDSPTIQNRHNHGFDRRSRIAASCANVSRPCIYPFLSLTASKSNEEYATLDRTPSVYSPLRSFHLPKGEQKHYQQQYADMYFARLAVLKPAVEKVASEAWDGFEVCTP